MGKLISQQQRQDLKNVPLQGGNAQEISLV